MQDPTMEPNKGPECVACAGCIGCAACGTGFVYLAVAGASAANFVIFEETPEIM